MTHPMNANPFPAAFVNFKADLRVWPISIPTNSNQCFVEWKMNLLTEEHAVDHMTQSMRGIMEMSLTSELSGIFQNNLQFERCASGAAALFDVYRISITFKAC